MDLHLWSFSFQKQFQNIIIYDILKFSSSRNIVVSSYVWTILVFSVIDAFVFRKLLFSIALYVSLSLKYIDAKHLIPFIYTRVINLKRNAHTHSHSFFLLLRKAQFTHVGSFNQLTLLWIVFIVSTLLSTFVECNSEYSIKQLCDFVKLISKLVQYKFGWRYNFHVSYSNQSIDIRWLILFINWRVKYE